MSCFWSESIEAHFHSMIVLILLIFGVKNINVHISAIIPYAYMCVCVKEWIYIHSIDVKRPFRYFVELWTQHTLLGTDIDLLFCILIIFFEYLLWSLNLIYSWLELKKKCIYIPLYEVRFATRYAFTPIKNPSHLVYFFIYLIKIFMCLFYPDYKTVYALGAYENLFNRCFKSVCAFYILLKITGYVI